MILPLSYITALRFWVISHSWYLSAVALYVHIRTPNLQTIFTAVNTITPVATMDIANFVRLIISCFETGARVAGAPVLPRATPTTSLAPRISHYESAVTKYFVRRGNCIYIHRRNCITLWHLPLSFVLRERTSRLRAAEMHFYAARRTRSSALDDRNKFLSPPNPPSPFLNRPIRWYVLHVSFITGRDTETRLETCARSSRYLRTLPATCSINNSNLCLTEVCAGFIARMCRNW